MGISTRALQTAYPQAQIIGVDLSPYFLAVAQFQAREGNSHPPASPPIQWRHAAAESTDLPDQSCDLVTAFLVVHELPQSATRAILQEARRLLRPGGHLAIMDSNPNAEGYRTMPPYVLTLLKSTEPYLDDYFTLDIKQAMSEAGFFPPVILRPVRDITRSLLRLLHSLGKKQNAAMHCFVVGSESVLRSQDPPGSLPSDWFLPLAQHGQADHTFQTKLHHQ